MVFAKIKDSSATLRCWHNTEYEMVVDPNLMMFVIDSPNYTKEIDQRFELCLYHPSFQFECVYIGNKEDIEIVEGF